jgi:hypothetical protein
MFVAVNIVLMAAVVVAMVAFLLHAIRSDHRHQQLQLQAGASRAEASRERVRARRADARRPAQRQPGRLSASRG